MSNVTPARNESAGTHTPLVWTWFRLCSLFFFCWLLLPFLSATVYSGLGGGFTGPLTTGGATTVTQVKTIKHDQDTRSECSFCVSSKRQRDWGYPVLDPQTRDPPDRGVTGSGVTNIKCTRKFPDFFYTSNGLCPCIVRVLSSIIRVLQSSETDVTFSSLTVILVAQAVPGDRTITGQSRVTYSVCHVIDLLFIMNLWRES